jgi:hypothetical protein
MHYGKRSQQGHNVLVFSLAQRFYFTHGNVPVVAPNRLHRDIFVLLTKVIILSCKRMVQ